MSKRLKNLFLTDEEAIALRLATRMLSLNRSQVALSLLLGVATLGSAIALAVVSAWLIARASQPLVIWFDLAIAATSVRMFGIARALFRYLERIASHTVALHGLTNLRTSIYRILASFPTQKVARLRQGEILARTGADVDAVGDFVVRSLLPTLTTALVSLGIVITFMFFSPWAALALALCLLLAGVVGPVVTIRAARLAELAAQEEQIELAASAMNLLTNAPQLAVGGRLEQHFSALETLEGQIKRTQDQAARPAAVAALMDHLAMMIAVLCGILIGVPLVLSGQLWDVNLAVLVLAPLAAFEGTAVLAPAAVQLVVSAGAARRIIDLLGGPEATEAALEQLARRHASAVDISQTTPTTTQATDTALDTVVATAPTTLTTPETAHLRAQNLQIGWPDGPVVATDINLELWPGHCVAIVGASGIGKTTLLCTLAGLIPAQQGQVSLSRRDINTMERREVCSQVVMTAEDAHVFYTSVLENLRVARGDIDEQEALRLLDEAGLGQWARALPQGVNTVLGSGGTTISGGERRRLLLARALATPAPLLLIDEPAEHLDVAMADHLVADLLLAGSTQNRGVLLVTHRLSALEKADEVLIMAPAGQEPFSVAAGGPHRQPAEIVARGTHEQLIETVPSYAWAVSQESFD